MIPFLVAASVLGLSRMSMERRNRALAMTIALCSVVSLAFGPWPGLPGRHFPAPDRWESWTPTATHREALRTAINLVPEDAPVAATNKVGSHLSARRYFFSVPRVGQARWVILDMNDPWVPLPPKTRVRATWGRSDPVLLEALKARLEVSPRWEKLFDREDVSVFRRAPHEPLEAV